MGCLISATIIIKGKLLRMMNHKTSNFKRVAPLSIDVVAPIAMYYILHLFGVRDAVAIGIGAFLPGVSTGNNLLKNKKLDQLGLFMTMMLLLGAALVLITDNPRLVLIKPAIFIAAASTFCFISLFGKPFMMTIAKPMATEGDSRLEKLWEQAWLQSQPFQTVIKRSTLVFGSALLIDAIGRVIIVYSMPINRSVAIANAPGIVAIAVAIVFHLKTVKPVFERLKQ